MCRPIRIQARKHNQIFISRLLNKTVTHNRFSKIALLKTGKVFRQSMILIWAKSYSSHHLCALSSTSSLPSVANNTDKNSLNYSLKNITLMDYLCTKLQYFQLTSSDFKAHQWSILAHSSLMLFQYSKDLFTLKEL